MRAAGRGGVGRCAAVQLSMSGIECPRLHTPTCTTRFPILTVDRAEVLDVLPTPGSPPEADTMVAPHELVAALKLNGAKSAAKVGSGSRTRHKASPRARSTLRTACFVARLTRQSSARCCML